MNENIEKFRESIPLLGNEELKELIKDIPFNDLVSIWDDLDTDEALKILSLLDIDDKVDLVRSLSPPRQEELIRNLSSEHAKVLLDEMEPDDLTDFIQSISPGVREDVYSHLSEESREETQFLLKFDEDDAAGLMTPRYLALRSSLSIAQALSWVRQHAKDVETVYNIYVIDHQKRLIGVVSLREILTSDDNEIIENIMEENIISVKVDTDQEEVAKILEAYDLLALPVVNEDQKLMGIVTFDDIIDVIREEQTEDIYKMGAMGGSTERYLESSIVALVKKRIPWITILLIAATFTTNVLDHFTSLMTAATVLALFIPTIIGTGGNSGTQSSTLMIRGLATGEIHLRDFWRVMAREIVVSTIIGFFMGILIILRSVFLPPFVGLVPAIAVGIALCFVIMVATMVGAIAPLLIKKLGADPTVMAGPLMATIIDLSGLTIYFLVAKAILGL
ncbi:MAG: magnesium transporter [Spirochaetales bacterium]|nr:magnesium transporter [Spirochaetales bacterium]